MMQALCLKDINYYFFSIILVRELQEANKLICVGQWCLMKIFWQRNTKLFSYKVDLLSYLNATLLISKYFPSLGGYVTFIILEKEEHKADNAQASYCQAPDMEKKQTGGVCGGRDASKLKVLKISQ